MNIFHYAKCYKGEVLQELMREGFDLTREMKREFFEEVMLELKGK